MSGSLDDGGGAAAGQLALDFWKLLRTAERIMAGLPEDKRIRVAAQLRFSSSRFDSHLESLGLSMPTFEGHQFGADLPAIAVNADDFESGENLIIDSAVEPALIWNGKVIQNARVMLREGQEDVSGN